MSIALPRWNQVVRVIAWTALGACAYLLITNDSHADSYIGAGIGVFNSGKNSHAETKFLNFGSRSPLGLGLTQQLEAGGWVDVAGSGRKSSGYGAYMLGVETDGPVFGRVMTGPALITTPDAYLGGHFQMTEHFALGLRGRNQNTVGVFYQHFSSGGLEMPNIGRDMSGVQISIPF